MDARKQALRGLLALSPRPHSKPEFEDVIRTAVVAQDEAKGASSSADTRRGVWEYVLRQEVLALAAREGDELARAPEVYYADIRFRLDLILVFTELDVCDAAFPFIVLQDLLETQTVGSCAHIFSWIEDRVARLRKGMVPSKGKALILLRTLNDVLRRLSRAGAAPALCGRILTFLSGVFPLGERSGVNLRGEYGPPWEGVQARLEETPADAPTRPASTETKAEADTMDIDAPGSTIADAKAQEKSDFYNTFWALQAPFARPSVFASDPTTFSTFKENVGRVLPVIKEASARDRAMMGSKTSANASAAAAAAASRKRKRGEDGAPTSSVPSGPSQDYFFAKFLTSPELLELEIADVHFRRQVLVQVLVLLEHLTTFAPEAKAKWATARNRSLQMDFVLTPDDQTWVKETAARAVDELKQTAPGGRAFAEATRIALARERNWVRWKAELCPPFDRPSWTGPDGVQQMWDAGEGARSTIFQEAEPWPHRLGTEPLTDIWDMGFREMRDLENSFQPGEVRDFAKKAAIEDRRIEQRQRILDKQTAARAAAAAEAAAALAAEDAEEIKADDVVMSTPTAAPSPASTPAPAASSSTAPTSSPSIHPSLPAKPGARSNAATATATAVTPEPTVAPDPSPPTALAAPAEPPKDREIARFEDAKARWSWLALRAARDGGATLVFGKPEVQDQPGGSVDLQALADAVDERRRDGIDPARRERPGSGPSEPEGAEDGDMQRSPSEGKDTETKGEESVQVEMRGQETGNADNNQAQAEVGTAPDGASTANTASDVKMEDG